MVAGEREGRRVGVFAFALADSDLPLQIAFPVLMANLMDWFTPQGALSDTAISIGQPEVIRPPLDAETVRVTAPDGTPAVTFSSVASHVPVVPAPPAVEL